MFLGTTCCQKSSCKNSLNVLLLTVRSLRKHHEDIEEFLSSLESPSNILYLTENWQNEIDETKVLIARLP